ncbi:hypothetical protein FCV25MIE_00968 [Fagus crenata]
MASTSSNVEFTSLVTLHHHDFRVERLRMWWDFFGLEEQVRIKYDIGMATSLLTMDVKWDQLQALASFWDPVLHCMSIGDMDLVLTIEEIVTPKFIRWREELGSSFLPMPPSRPAMLTSFARSSLQD